MVNVLRQGDKYFMISEEDVGVYKSVPPGTYSLSQDAMSKQYFLKNTKNISVYGKFYGNVVKNTNRILETFHSRATNTGVLLNGVKGSGKTLLAKNICVKGAETRGLPTILVDNGYHGDDFNRFMQSIDFPCIVLFDEFEKLYGYSDQDKILTLLDGVYGGKKLFILTVNDIHRVSTFLTNRPGRIYYNLSFDTLDESFIREYCEDNLNDKSKIEDIISYTKIYSFFNFDMLMAAVEEMNRYNENLGEVLEYLNIQPEMKRNDRFTFTLEVTGIGSIVLENDKEGFDPSKFQYVIPENIVKKLEEPFKGVIDDFIETSISINEAHNGRWFYNFETKDLAAYNSSENEFVFKKDFNGYEINLKVRKNVASRQISTMDLLSF